MTEQDLQAQARATVVREALLTWGTVAAAIGLAAIVAHAISSRRLRTKRRLQTLQAKLRANQDLSLGETKALERLWLKHEASPAYRARAKRGR